MSGGVSVCFDYANNEELKQEMQSTFPQPPETKVNKSVSTSGVIHNPFFSRPSLFPISKRMVDRREPTFKRNGILEFT
jgi:hypothetical protein